MKRPLIGIVPLVDAQRESYWMLPGYMRGVEQAGGLPIMLPLTDDDAALRQLADTCDGFLLTGGQDVSPALYGAAPVPACGETCPARDAMETKLLALALHAVPGPAHRAPLGGGAPPEAALRCAGTQCHAGAGAAALPAVGQV